jgi:hypothetical protein
MEAMFAIRLGGQEAYLSIKALCREFEIAPGSADAKLVETAIAGLRYVPSIRPGDSIPSELLDGTASWKIEERHSLLASSRIQAQLLSWLTGKETVITEAAELEMFLGQVENKNKLREAFSRAAKVLGHGEQDHAIVVDLIETLARELAYIEALRDSFRPVAALTATLVELARVYSSDKRTCAEIQSINKLMERAMADHQKRFAYIDAQTAEIIGALKSLDRQIQFIRKMRDELHFQRTDWMPVLAAWEHVERKRAPATEKLLSQLYRHLASRYATAQSMLKRPERSKAA